jgi:hypothetical protein
VTQDLGPALVHLDIRPVRLAYLVRRGSIPDFRAAITEASSRWGGIREPIIPFDAHGTIDPSWDQYLSRFPVDLVCRVAELDRAETSRLRERIGREAVSLADVQTSCALHATAVHSPHFAPTTYSVCAPASSGPGSLAALGLAEDADQVTAWARVGRRPNPAPTGVIAASAQLQAVTLIHMTAEQCGETVLHGFVRPPIVIWVAEDESLEDAVEFWNMRSLAPLRLGRLQACLVSPDTFSDPQFSELLRRTLTGRSYTTSPDLLVYSRSLPPEERQALVEKLGFTVFTGMKLESARRTGDEAGGRELTAAVKVSPWQFVAVPRDDGVRATALTTLRREDTIIRVDSPVPFQRAWQGTVYARFSGPPQLEVPSSRSVPVLFERAATMTQGYLEVATMPSETYTFHLRLPERQAVFRAFFDDRGVRFTLSDKGKLATGVAQIIPTPGALRNPVALEVIRALTTKRIAHDVSALRAEFSEVSEEHLQEIAEKLANIRQADRSLHDIASAIAGREPDVGVELDELVRAGVVIRG